MMWITKKSALETTEKGPDLWQEKIEEASGERASTLTKRPTRKNPNGAMRRTWNGKKLSKIGSHQRSSWAITDNNLRPPELSVIIITILEATRVATNTKEMTSTTSGKILIKIRETISSQGQKVHRTKKRGTTRIIGRTNDIERPMCV